jgi:RNA polymerase sigma-70 factor (ECF subfamily)
VKEPPGDVTRLLDAWCGGDARALDELAPLVESELRRVARAYLRREAPGCPLQPTELVNEAYVRLIGWNAGEWQNRAHFYAVAAKLMRRVLVSHAIRRGRSKRGGSLVLVSLTDAGQIAQTPSTDVVALDEALQKLEAFDARKSQLVELRFFGGLTAAETAEVMNTSLRTINREWSLARAWLFRELTGDNG